MQQMRGKQPIRPTQIVLICDRF